MLEIRDRLQAIEDKLVAAGFDEFIVATDAGTFSKAFDCGNRVIP
jgi:hypothetical protein